MKIILKPEELFTPVSETGNIAHRSILGGINTLSSQGVLFVLRTTSTIILARLLTPQDFGLIGMVTVIISLATMFKTAGLSMATVQKDDITHNQISTLFWLNLIISIGLGLLVLASSPFVAMFYGKPELAGVTAALSISFVISGLAIQHQALLKRHMRFGALAIITIVAQALQILVAIILALIGLRYWALVWSTIASAIATIMLTYIFCPWIPSKMRRGTGVRKMLLFGGHLTGFNFVNYFSRNTDYILIGKFLGADALGLYTKAYHLFLMPISQIRTPINNVAMPALCAIRNNSKRYRTYYSTIIFLIAALTMPLVSIMLVHADNIIMLMLGKQWRAAVSIFQILALVGFIQAAVQAGRGLPLMSMGHSKRYLYFGLVQASVTILGIVIGLQWGIVGVAAGYGVAFYLLIPFTLGWCLKDTPVKVLDWLKAVSSPIFATLTMIPVMLLIRKLLQQERNAFDVSVLFNLKIVLIGSIVGLTIYLLIVLLVPSGRMYIKSIREQFKLMMQKRRTSE